MIPNEITEISKNWYALYFEYNHVLTFEERKTELLKLFTSLSEWVIHHHIEKLGEISIIENRMSMFNCKETIGLKWNILR